VGPASVGYLVGDATAHLCLWRHTGREMWWASALGVVVGYLIGSLLWLVAHRKAVAS
jgi:hypothetical protein